MNQSKKKYLLGLCLLAIFFTPKIYANSKFYAGADVTHFGYKEQYVEEANPIGLTLKIGQNFHKNLAIEGRVGLPLTSDPVIVDYYGEHEINVEVGPTLGIYLKPSITVEALRFYGLAGFTRAKITAEIGGYKFSDTDTSPSFGVGMDLNIDKITLNVELSHLISTDEYDLTALSLGASYAF